MFDIEELANQVAKEEKMLEAKKVFLKQLQAESNRKTFSETKFGKAYFNVIQVCTSPFANLHQKAQDMINCPEKVEAQDLIKKGNKILDQALKFEDNQVQGAESMAIKCATHVISLEKFTYRHQNQHPVTFQKLISELDDQVQRLRPKMNEDKLKDIDKAILSYTQGVHHAF